ncbi:hypothetical protein TSOC_001187 [Tetrabaena socialis]|uniref:Uncharacterized protein n=1 Tax=Tetrabaena socialis TaxID=47790 RepID=A0A2J8AHI8_9CHLO|nr:hypothetical protein TSOC_001187 [Tetrabaena socialis]|eukprot:PNH11971.1 hypothetical protein TSOC_001187 [Tetrabaena socialis]
MAFGMCCGPFGTRAHGVYLQRVSATKAGHLALMTREAGVAERISSASTRMAAGAPACSATESCSSSSAPSSPAERRRGQKGRVAQEASAPPAAYVWCLYGGVAAAAKTVAAV